MTQTTRSRTTASTGARVCNILSLVFAAIAVVFFPIFFGIAAIVLAVIGFSLGDRALGRWSLPIAVVATVLGFLLGYLALPS
jgi:hypothetical protein